MVEQLFDGFRKASESSLQMQQEMLKHWTQQWTSVAPSAANASGDAGRAAQPREAQPREAQPREAQPREAQPREAQQRWLALGLELLDKHRASLDSTYTAGIQLIGQTFRTSEVKSAEDYRRLTEELWRKLFETYKTQSETQWSTFQRWSAKSTEAARDARP